MTSLRTQLEELAGKADEHSAVLDIISDFIDDMPHIQKDVKAVAAFLEEFTALAPTILSALEAVEWRPIETAPRDGSPFMLWVAEGETGPHVFATVSITSEGQWWDDSTGDQIEPISFATHWRPLGPTPTEGNSPVPQECALPHSENNHD